MEEEIQIGELVRTKRVGIQKIDHMDLNKPVNRYRYFLEYDDDGDKCYGIIKTTEIEDHSTDIKKLVRTGDIIKYKVSHLNGTMYGEVNNYWDKTAKEYLGVHGWSLDQIEILKVGTKEQMEKYFYNLEDEYARERS